MVRLGLEDTAGSRRHGPLTISRASTHVARLIRRVVDLASAHKHAARRSVRLAAPRWMAFLNIL